MILNIYINNIKAKEISYKVCIPNVKKICNKNIKTLLLVLMNDKSIRVISYASLNCFKYHRSSRKYKFSTLEKFEIFSISLKQFFSQKIILKKSCK
jgi:hypothetical protein